MKKTIGILGGMGPEATTYFFSLIIRHTQAAKDQDHVPILIVNDPRIPERTAALLGRGPSPIPLLRKGLRTLERGGADFAVVPCVTAHAFLPRAAAAARIPVVDILEETLAYVEREMPGLKKAGLIASTGTVRSRLFQKLFSGAGIEIITPAGGDQENIMTAVFGPGGIKAGVTAGNPKKLILAAARRLIRRGAEAVIAGCTEVPLVIGDEDISVPLIEPLRIAARASILRAGYKLKNQKTRRAS